MSLPAVFAHGNRKLAGFQVPGIEESRRSIYYHVVIYSQTAEITQQIRFRKLGDAWQQRYVVQRTDPATGEQVVLKQFPAAPP